MESKSRGDVVDFTESEFNHDRKQMTASIFSGRRAYLRTSRRFRPQVNTLSLEVLVAVIAMKSLAIRDRHGH